MVKDKFDVYKIISSEVLNEVKQKYKNLKISDESYQFIFTKVWNNIMQLNARGLIESVTKDVIKDFYKLQMDRFILGILNNMESKNLLNSITNGLNGKEKLIGLLKVLCDYDINLDEVLATHFIENNDITNILSLLPDKEINTILYSKLDKNIINNLNILLIAYKKLSNININHLEMPIMSLDDYANKNDFEAMNKYMSTLPKETLTYYQEIELFKRFKKGDKKAFDLLVLYNQKMIVRIIRGNLNKGLSFFDLLQEGNIFLIEAINKFDLSKGCKLSTYAYFYISKRINRYINAQSRFIKLGHTNEIKLKQLINARKKIELLYGEVDIDKLIEITGFTEDEIINLDNLPNKVVSINRSLNIDTTDEFIDEYCFDDYYDIGYDESLENQFEIQDLRTRLFRIMNDLKFSYREKLILYYHYGFDRSSEKTLEEIGEIFDISKARVGIIKDAKLLEMRHYINGNRELIDYYIPEDTLLYSPLSYWIEKIMHRTESGRTLSNILDYYQRYGEESFYLMFEKLSDREQEILFKLYGSDFNHLELEALTNEEYKYFFEFLVPKMTSILRRIKGTIKK